MPDKEKGYWFTTETGTHIHAEEGETPKEATEKRFKNFKKGGENKSKGKNPFKKAYDNFSQEEKDEVDTKIKASKELADEGISYDEDYERSYGPNAVPLRKKWERFNEVAYTGDDDDIRESQELLAEIEEELPFKDEAEHERWLDLLQSDMGEGKIEKLTEEILARKENKKDDDYYTQQYTELARQYGNAKTKAEKQAIAEKMNALKKEQYPDENKKTAGEVARDNYNDFYYKEAMKTENPREHFIKRNMDRFGVPKGSSRAKEEEFYGKEFDKLNNPKNESFDNINAKRMGKEQDKYQQAFSTLEKLGIKEEDFGVRENIYGKYEDNTDKLVKKYVTDPYRKNYPNGNKEAYEKEYAPIYDALLSAREKHWNEFWKKPADQRGYMESLKKKDLPF